jgi:hypothetical protein
MKIPTLSVRSALFASSLLLAVLAITTVDAYAQTPGEVVVSDSLMELRRAGGSTVIGRVVAVDGDRITFETIEGERFEVRSQFARIRPARGRIVDGDFWREDQHTSRLFFGPTGRTLRAGAGYAGLFFILPFVGYGVTDNFTMAGGIPITGSLSQTPIWVAPKLRVYNAPRMQVSTGLFAVYIPNDDSGCEPPFCQPSTERDPSFVGIAYGVGTFGDNDNAVHAGVGIPFAGSDVSSQLPVMVGGELRISRRNKLISENWFLPGEGGAASGGIRIMGSRWTTDLGLMFLLSGDSNLPYFPIVSFSYAFGGGR